MVVGHAHCRSVKWLQCFTPALVTHTRGSLPSESPECAANEGPMVVPPLPLHSSGALLLPRLLRSAPSPLSPPDGPPKPASPRPAFTQVCQVLASGAGVSGAVVPVVCAALSAAPSSGRLLHFLRGFAAACLSRMMPGQLGASQAAGSSPL